MRLAEAGRGLALVDALCDRLTWQPNNSGGKVVRCHWRLKAATDSARIDPQPLWPLRGLTSRTSSPVASALAARTARPWAGTSRGEFTRATGAHVPELTRFCFPAITRRASFFVAYLAIG
jgi:hypothetical protein